MEEIDLGLMVSECIENEIYPAEREKVTICMLKDLYPQCQCLYLGMEIKTDRKYTICEKYSKNGESNKS